MRGRGRCRVRVRRRRNVGLRRYLVDAELLKLIDEATTDSGETDTAKWMTGAR